MYSSKMARKRLMVYLMTEKKRQVRYRAKRVRVKWNTFSVFYDKHHWLVPQQFQTEKKKKNPEDKL